LNIPASQEVCFQTEDAKGADVTECVTSGVHGFDELFCRPLPGFNESYVVVEWVGSLWQVIDCSDGRSVEILIRDEANGLELTTEMIAYREGLLDSGAKPSISDIIGHMVSLGSKFEFRAESLDPAETKRFCSYSVVQEEPCLSGADIPEN